MYYIINVINVIYINIFIINNIIDIFYKYDIYATIQLYICLISIMNVL